MAALKSSLREFPEHHIVFLHEGLVGIQRGYHLAPIPLKLIEDGTPGMCSRNPRHVAHEGPGVRVSLHHRFVGLLHFSFSSAIGIIASNILG